MIEYKQETFNEDVRTMAAWVFAWEEVTTPHLRWQPSLIIGIARGGLIPAVHLSHALSVRMQCIHWQLRDGNLQDPVSVANNNQVLIVDDINDSGETFCGVINSIKNNSEISEKALKQNIKTASLFSRKSSKFAVDYSPNKVDTNDWINFPWEQKNNA